MRRTTFDTVTAGLTPDRSVPRASTNQPEFERPLQRYVEDAASPGRVSKGRLVARTDEGTLETGLSRFGVPGEIPVSGWGMESDYGRSSGRRDVVRTLATLAWTRADRPTFRDEFVAAAVILDRGLVARAQLVGSWAGAMGGPQFLPSTYLKYAVSAAGDGAAPDIWTKPADVLLSVANFMRGEGWTAGEPWMTEVILPAGLDLPTLHATAADWARLGLRRADGQVPAGQGEASLFLPAGIAGPAFLLFPNYFVIKRYNNSDSYAVSFGLLAQRIAGAGALATPWPAHPVGLSRADRLLVQQRLAAAGLYDGPLDGKFGPKARDAVFAFQKQAGLAPADGFATPALVARLRAR